MVGGKADRAFTGYVRLCGQLVTSVLMPVITRLPFFIKWAGEHVEYLLDAQIKAHNEKKFFDNFAGSTTNGSHHGETHSTDRNGQSTVITVQVKDITEERKKSIAETKQANPYDDKPDIEDVED